MVTGVVDVHQNQEFQVEKLVSDTVQADDIVLNDVQAPAGFTIALAKSATTNGMKITVTAKDSGGTTLAQVVALDLWMSEATSGVGLTGDTYSGDLAASTGAILGALTAKKAWRVQTATSGIFEAVLVASANPADQYVVVSHPATGAVTVSAASGTNWEGAT
jgi:hypothetical protein